MTEPITQHSISRAADEAVKLWALASAQYPKQHGLILDLARASIIETVSAFALNARRALEILPAGQKFQLTQPRWRWTPRNDGEVVNDLWDALNRIIHAQKLEVGFEELPKEVAVMAEGALVVPYVRAATDRKKLAFIDPFALSHAFLYGAFPLLVGLEKISSHKSLLQNSVYELNL
ncbi:MAG: hypothetical protein HKM00_04120 [Gallionella sp.]|nr:hypothetical protein [Gallionella sp.]